MIQLDNLKNDLLLYENSFDDIKKSLDIDNKNKRIDELNLMMEDNNLWNDTEKANKLTKELKDIRNEIMSFEKLYSDYKDILVLIDIANEDNDEKLIPEIKKMSNEFISKIEVFKTRLLLSGEFDNLCAIVRLNAGSGGTESCDFCAMLYRMYSRYAQFHNFSLEVLDYLAGDEAGIKSVTFLVSAEYAYGLLKSEAGVHRLVRMSPFNTQGKRQTSFVGCDVMPDIKDNIDIDVNEEDLKIDYYRASGAGGQHINKTSSAVRITHLPTGIVVACQEQRSQHMNKERAMQMLKAKLYMIKQQENESKINNIRGEIKENAFGSQIRSYVLQPYRLVKDLRTGEETSDTDAVLNGEIDNFINSYLRWLKLGCPNRKVMLKE